MHADAAAEGLSSAQQGQQHSPPAVPWSVVPPPAKRPRQDDATGPIALKLTFATAQQNRQRGGINASVGNDPSIAAAAASSSTQAAVSSPAVAAVSSSSAAVSARSSWREDPDLQDDLDWPEEEVLLSCYRPSQRYPPPAPQHATRMTLQITSRDVVPLQIARTARRARNRSPATVPATADTIMADASNRNVDADGSAVSALPAIPPAASAASPPVLQPPSELQPGGSSSVASSPSPSPAISPQMPSPASASPPLPDPPPATAAVADDPPSLPSSQNSSISIAVPLGRRGRRPSIGSQLHQLSAVQEGDEDRIEESQRTSQQQRSQAYTGEERKSPHTATPSSSSRTSSRNVSPAAESKKPDSAPPSRSPTPSQSSAAPAVAAASSSLVPPTFSQPSSSQQSASQLSAGPMSLWPDDYPSLSYFYEDFPRTAEDDEKREEERFQQLAQDVPVPTADEASQEHEDAPVSSQLMTQVMPTSQAVVSSQLATQQLEQTPVATAATAVLPTPPASTPRVSARNAARVAAAAASAAATTRTPSTQSTPPVGRLRRLVSSSTRHTRSHDASQA